MSYKLTSTGIKPNPKKKLVLKCWFEKVFKSEKCRCEEIKIIQKCIRLWYTTINKLESITYNNDEITYRCINVFRDDKNRSKNDSNNKKRENIIVCIIKNKIPIEYYRYPRWLNLKKGINSYIQKLCEMKCITNIENIVCNHKAGRGNHYDFKIIINSEEFNIEFKFNASCVDDTPQFVSPMKPSQYLNMKFLPWYYDNYLIKIAEYGNLEMPSKEEYCKKNHNNKVECMKPYKEKYDNDSKFRAICKKISKEGIKKFIEMTEINKDVLSHKLLESQKNKHYMCYNKNKFNYDTVDENSYKITKIIKKENTNYIYQTATDMKLEIKLRFKNGCGLIFPAFQIKRKVPSVKELKKICVSNNIKPPHLKKDICNILNKHSIMY